jgi:amino-acid N-acetyltransferase
MSSLKVDMMDLRLTTDYEAVRKLALAAGLEDGPFDNLVRTYGLFIEDAIVASVALKRSGEVFSVEWLAVEERLRGQGLGRRMVSKVANDARSFGATHLWALARAPEFFLRIGFKLSPEEQSPGPTFAGCSKCRQFRQTCHPRIVVLDLSHGPR